ncbi:MULTISPECIES: hypothetical protein [Nocardia]|uniref:hypothetical protein n=1 Tax=Nocardia TaxID=1817 RepID=UPI000AD89FE2|nr:MULTISPECIES: hypothetical protein [Nocardia]MBF6278303.1 hypothetical protein [Nocardia nova]
MNLETGTVVLGKITVRSRTNKRMEPLFALVDNEWQDADPATFKPSHPLKIENDSHVETNAPIIAELTEAPKLPGKGDKIFRLSSVRAANVVIDRRDEGPANRVIENINELAIPRWANDTTEIFLLCEGDILLGPLRLVKRKPVAPHPERLEIRRTNGMVVANFDGYLVGDRIKHLPVHDYIDCRPINEILDDVTTLAVSTLTDLDFDETHIQATKQTLTKISNWITDRNASGGDSLDSQRVQRALQACKEADAQHQLASQIAYTLTGLPTVAALMDQAIEEARANAEKDELNEIRNRVALETKRLADLEKDLNAAGSEFQQLNERIVQAHQDLITAQEQVKTRNEELRGDVAVAVEELVNGARERLTSSVIAQALTKNSAPAHSSSSPSPMSPNLRPIAKSILTEKNAIKKQFNTAVKTSGIKGPAAQRLFAALSAGLLPITLGNGGPASLSAIANLMFSGRVARIPVAHDFLHPTDLLGLHSAKPGAFRSHYGILEAANSEAATGEVVVVLEGINQAPTESYLVPWLQSHWEDTGFASLQPHPNLRLAGSMATGITSARICPDLWGYAIAVDIPRIPTWAGGNEFSHVRSPESIGRTDYDVFSNLLADVEPLWPFSEDVTTAAQRFASALQFHQTEEQIHLSVAECILLPVGANSLAEGEYEEFVAGLGRTLSLEDETAASYRSLAKRLRVRLA